MGCGSSALATVTTLSWETDKIGGRIPKRVGHPSHYKLGEGYDFGVRIRVRNTHQSIFVGTSKSNQKRVTIQENNLKTLGEEFVIEQVMILAKINSHPNIFKLQEVFVSKEYVHCIFNYVDPMRLKQFVDINNHKTNLKLADCKQIIKSIASALIHCHSLDIVVRGLLPEHIMVVKQSAPDSNGNHFLVQLTDFSMATSEVYNKDGSLRNLSDHPLFEWSDVFYMPPEAILGHPFSTSLDMWSVGVLLYSMLSAYLPFDQKDDKILVNAIKSASFTFDGPAWGDIPDHVKKTVSDLLIADPTARKSAAELSKVHWLTN